MNKNSWEFGYRKAIPWLEVVYHQSFLAQKTKANQNKFNRFTHFTHFSTFAFCKSKEAQIFPPGVVVHLKYFQVSSQPHRRLKYHKVFYVFLGSSV